MASDKPRVLVLGGLGFIGKHLIKYLVDNNVASKIRVCDKTNVAMARVGAEFNGIFDKVECIQVNLTDPDSVARAFKDPDGDYGIVINLAGETKLAQTEEVYAQGVTKLSTLCAQEAAKHKTTKYIEVSTAEVYEPTGSLCTESSPLKPWTNIAKAKLNAEEEVKNVKGLPWVIARPAHVYGPGEVRGTVIIRLCSAACYKKSGQTMETFPWCDDQKINAVHVRDVAKALWHLAVNAPEGSIYNLAGSDDLDSKKFFTFQRGFFGIKIEHINALKAEVIKKLSIEEIKDGYTDQILPNWLKLMKENKLEYSALSPYLEEEQFVTTGLGVDGSAIQKLNFTYDVPAVTAEALKEELLYAVELGWFPPNYFKDM